MKKFLTLTLVLFLSLFIVGESGAEYISTKEILLNGEVIGSAYSDEERYFYNIVRYKNEVYWCQTYNPSLPQFERSTSCRVLEL